MHVQTLTQLRSLKPSNGTSLRVLDNNSEYTFRESRPDLIPDDDTIFSSLVPGRPDDRWEREVSTAAGGGGGGGAAYPDNMIFVNTPTTLTLADQGWVFCGGVTITLPAAAPNGTTYKFFGSPGDVILDTNGNPIVGIGAGASVRPGDPNITLVAVNAPTLLWFVPNRQDTGNYNAARVYYVGQVVKDGSSWYMSIVSENVGNPTSDAASWLPIGGSSGASENIAVYDQDIGATSGVRYKTWAEVMAAVATWGAIGGEVIVRKAGVFQTATVPAGSYDLSAVALRGAFDSILPVLSFSAESTLTGFPRIIEAVIVENNNTAAPLHTVSGFGLTLLRDGSIRNGATASKPALSVPNGSSFSLSIQNGTSPLYAQSGGSEPVDVRGSLSVDVWRLPANSLFTQNNVFTNEVSGIGNIFLASHVLIPGGYAATHANYDGNINVSQIAETRAVELLTTPEGWAALRAAFYGNSQAPYIESPLPANRKGSSNEAPAGIFNFAVNPGDLIQDRQVIMVDATVYVGQIVGGVLSDRVYKLLMKFTRNGSIASLDKDFQVVSSSPSAGGPACTITAYDDGAGQVGVSVQNDTANTLRIFVDLTARVNDDAVRGPYFVS